MKTLTANMQAHLAQRVHTLANCWRLTRADGTVMGFTDLDQDIVYNAQDGDGFITYEANTAMTASALSSSSELRVDTQDTIGFIRSTRITADDIRAGRYDNAEVKYFKVNWADLTASMGDIKMKKCTVGEVKTSDPRFTVELRSLSQAYSQNIVDLVRPACGVDLGSAKCKVTLEPSVWLPGTAYTLRQDRDAGTGSLVTPSVFNDRHFICTNAGTSGSDEPTWNTTIGGTTPDGDAEWTAIRATTLPSVEVIEVVDQSKFWLDYTGDAPDSFFTLGLIECLTGDNVNLRREIRVFSTNSDGPVYVETFLPFPFDVDGAGTATGADQMKLFAGCDKRRATCRDTFDNIENYHGFPDVPGTDVLYRTPNAPG
jgi:hypothetical protein